MKENIIKLFNKVKKYYTLKNGIKEENIKSSVIKILKYNNETILTLYTSPNISVIEGFDFYFDDNGDLKNRSKFKIYTTTYSGMENILIFSRMLFSTIENSMPTENVTYHTGKFPENFLYKMIKSYIDFTVLYFVWEENSIKNYERKQKLKKLLY